MTPQPDSPWPYAPAFAADDAPFLTWWEMDDQGLPHPHAYTRGRFLDLTRRAVTALRRLGAGPGTRVVHGFGGNHYLDLVFRLAASRIGAVPVTVNWEADNAARIAYKIRHTDACLLVHDALFAEAHLDEVAAALPGLSCLDVEAWRQAPDAPDSGDAAACTADAEKIIIFTSGTTGNPKGVSHDETSYRANGATFDAFFNLSPGAPASCLVTSALHHANATAVCDWCLRRPGAVLHLISRYSTRYWELLHTVAAETDGLLVAPVVSRHFDFLASLDAHDRLPVPLPDLRTSLARVTFLIGSAPVGPTTVKRIGTYTGRLPVVRFGSSETCLQVMGIPHHLSEEARMLAFRRGWAREERVGYYIGRPHPGHTQVRVVAGIHRGGPGFMEDVPEGVPGYLITRGDNLMTGYVGDPEGTARVMEDGWYLGLEDIGFYLNHPEDGEADFYWMSRESTLLIKGGANYAYDQINTEVLGFLQDKLGLAPGQVDVAVVGLKIDSEHEDTACLTVSLLAEDTTALRRSVTDLLLGPEAKAGLTKGARPDKVRFGAVPRNFKGAVVVSDLRAAFEG